MGDIFMYIYVCWVDGMGGFVSLFILNIYIISILILKNKNYTILQNNSAWFMPNYMPWSLFLFVIIMIKLACNYTLHVNDYLMCDKGEVLRFKLINLFLNLKETSQW